MRPSVVVRSCSRSVAAQRCGVTPGYLCALAQQTVLLQAAPSVPAGCLPHCCQGLAQLILAVRQKKKNTAAFLHTSNPLRCRLLIAWGRCCDIFPLQACRCIPKIIRQCTRQQQNTEIRFPGRCKVGWIVPRPDYPHPTSQRLTACQQAEACWADQAPLTGDCRQLARCMLPACPACQHARSLGGRNATSLAATAWQVTATAANFALRLLIGVFLHVLWKF